MKNPDLKDFLLTRFSIFTEDLRSGEVIEASVKENRRKKFQQSFIKFVKYYKLGINLEEITR